jgi:hypothetical protein
MVGELNTKMFENRGMIFKGDSQLEKMGEKIKLN